LRAAGRSGDYSREGAGRCGRGQRRGERGDHHADVLINGRRYDGPRDGNALADAMLGTLGRVRAAALDFASWRPSAGVLLLLATIVAGALMNTGLGPSFAAFWEQQFGLTFGGRGFSLSLLHWINAGLLTLASRSSAPWVISRAGARPRCRSPARSAARPRRRRSIF
jgi:Na+/H+ antiporter 1